MLLAILISYFAVLVVLLTAVPYYLPRFVNSCDGEAMPPWGVVCVMWPLFLPVCGLSGAYAACLAAGIERLNERERLRRFAEFDAKRQLPPSDPVLESATREVEQLLTTTPDVPGPT